MKDNQILLISSSGRYEGSLTRQVSKVLVEYLDQHNPSSSYIERDVAQGLPFVDEAWITSNFTPPSERTADQEKVLSLSNELVSECEKADHIVIATPVYNFSIPASLKAWVDLIARAGLTFHYTENGPEGLLKNKKATIIIASGGVPIGSEMDMASAYLKIALGFVGITEMNIIDATTINIDQDKLETESQIKALIN